MLNKKILMLLICAMSLLTVSAVCGAENAAGDILSIENATVEVASDNQTIIATESGAGTFEELAGEISATPQGATLNLVRDYRNGASGDAIIIQKPITIDGQGHTIDANHLSGIFDVKSNGVTLKNIIFINGYDSENGGAIHFKAGSSSNIMNSSFINCSAMYGGALYLDVNADCTITDSNFENNAAGVLGGSIFAVGGNDVSLNRTTFSKCISRYDCGGAVMLINGYLGAEYIEIADCVSDFGGAITLLNSTSNIKHSAFKRNRATYDGGAIFAMHGFICLEANVFSDNSANRGGGLYLSKTDTYIIDNSFELNSASNGGAAYFNAINKIIIDRNVFANNTGSPEPDFCFAFNDNLTITSDDYYQFRYQDSNCSTLPSYYSMYDENLVSPVKNQGVDGNCWAFSAFSTLESCILKASGLCIDLSEANLKNLMTCYSDYGYLITTNEGGHSEMAWGYLASWLGPIFDTDDDYFAYDFLSPLLKSVLHIQNIVFLKRSDYTDNDNIKNAILKYGGVSTSMYFDTEYLSDSFSYYYSGTNSQDHAVCIVGWDDSYSRYNFNKTPAGDGAWIVKNSWGPSWGDAGYFYVSYYDSEFARVNETCSYTFILNDTIKYDRIYQLEIQPTGYVNLTGDKICYKNIFTVEGNEYLAAVSTYFTDECDYSLSVYVNDVLSAKKAGRTNAGYYTIDLDDFIRLNKNDEVAVIFNCTNYNGGIAKLPYSANNSCANLFLESGVSYYWEDGRWVDLNLFGCVACMKMFTAFSAESRLNPYLNVMYEGDARDNSFLIEVMLPNDATGMFSIRCGPKEYLVNISTGKSIRLYNLNENNNTLTVRYGGDEKYIAKTVTCIIDTHIPEVGTFDELLNKIIAFNRNGILNLTKDYEYVSGTTDGIDIGKPITIDGRGHTIDGKQLSKIVNVYAKGVTLKNIRFTGGIGESEGVVRVINSNCTIVNCSFEDNSVTEKNGGALYWGGNNGVLAYSTFTDNSASTTAGAAYWSGDDGIIFNCTFENNAASGGGAIGGAGENCIISNCLFISNSASEGGAIFWKGKCVTVLDSSFMNNTAFGGSAISLHGANSNVVNSTFAGNNASGAGAIYCNAKECLFSGCEFADNSASSIAGAIIIENTDNMIENCIFTNNFANNSGAVIIIGEGNILVNCLFTNNTASKFGGAVFIDGDNCILVNCSFEANSAESAGAACISGGGNILVNCLFSDNVASVNGGGIFWDGSEGLLFDSSFKRNSAKTGGAVLWTGSKGRLEDSYFEDNFATKGASSAYWGGSDGNFDNCTLVDNLKSNQIYWNAADGNISCCTFINNTHCIVNHGATFTKRSMNLSSAYALDYKVMTVESMGTLNEVPISSKVILYKGSVIKSFTVDSSNKLLEQLCGLDCGEWSATVTFNGDDNYDSFNIAFSITINPLNSSLSLEGANATVGHEITLKASVENGYNFTIDEGTVTFLDGGVEMGSSRVSGGVAEWRYVAKDYGKHEITAVYTSNNYVTSRASFELMVDSVSVEVLTERGTVGFKSNFTANVNAIYSVVDDGNVAFYIDDVFIAKVAVVNGSASVGYVPLAAGNHVVKALYCDSAKFMSAEGNASYEVSKAKSKLTVNDLNATVGHSVTLTAIVSSPNNLTIDDGFVIFFDGDSQIGKAQVKNGIAAWTYAPSVGGEHEISAVFNSDNYLSSNATAKLLADSASVEVSADNGTIGFKSTFTANVKALYSVVDDGNVAFYVGDMLIGKVAVADGSASVDYVPLAAGDYALKAVYCNSNKFIDDEDSVSYKVSKADSKVQISDFNATVGHALTLEARVSSSNNLTIDDGVVTFFDGSAEIGSANVEGGIATLTYAPAADGKHKITAVYSSNNYASSNATSELLVDSTAVNLVVDGGIVGFKSTFTANVKALYSVVDDGNVAFYVGDMLIGKVAVADGSASLDYVPLAAGDYAVKAVYCNSSKFMDDENTASYAVSKADSKLTIDDFTGTVGYELAIAASLSSSNNLTISEGTVIFLVDGVEIGSSNVAAGTAALKYVPTSAGNHEITAKYSGVNYQSSSSTSRLAVSKAGTRIAFGDVATVYWKNPTSFKVSVSSNGNPVCEGTVKFYIDGTEIESQSLNDGSIAFDYISPDAGTFSIVAKFEETKNYLSSDAGCTFEVLKLPTSISASSVETVYNGGKYMTVTLKDNTNNPIGGVNVVVNINGAKTLRTDSNGQIKVSTDGLIPKTYYPTVSFDGSTNYEKSSSTAKVTVKKATVKLTAKAKTFKKSVKTKKYTITLKTNQNKVMKNTKVTIKVNKKTYSAKTNSKGVATFKITKLTKKGKYTATVKYAGSNCYNAKTVKPKITIK